MRLIKEKKLKESVVGRISTNPITNEIKRTLGDDFRSNGISLEYYEIKFAKNFPVTSSIDLLGGEGTVLRAESSFGINFLSASREVEVELKVIVNQRTTSGGMGKPNTIFNIEGVYEFVKSAAKGSLKIEFDR